MHPPIFFLSSYNLYHPAMLLVCTTDFICTQSLSSILFATCPMQGLTLPPEEVKFEIFGYFLDRSVCKKLFR